MKSQKGWLWMFVIIFALAMVFSMQGCEFRTESKPVVTYHYENHEGKMIPIHFYNMEAYKTYLVAVKDSTTIWIDPLDSGSKISEDWNFVTDGTDDDDTTPIIGDYYIMEYDTTCSTVWIDSFNNVHVDWSGITVYIEAEDVKVVYDDGSYFVRNDTITILKTGTFGWVDGTFRVIKEKNQEVKIGQIWIKKNENPFKDPIDKYEILEIKDGWVRIINVKYERKSYMDSEISIRDLKIMMKLKEEK